MKLTRRKWLLDAEIRKAYTAMAKGFLAPQREHTKKTIPPMPSAEVKARREARRKARREK